MGKKRERFFSCVASFAPHPGPLPGGEGVFQQSSMNFIDSSGLDADRRSGDHKEANNEAGNSHRAVILFPSAAEAEEMFLIKFQTCGASSAEALAQQVRHLNEKCSTIAPEAGFKISGERVESVAIQIVVIPNVERRTGVRRPAHEKLSANIRFQGDRKSTRLNSS